MKRSETQNDNGKQKPLLKKRIRKKIHENQCRYSERELFLGHFRKFDAGFKDKTLSKSYKVPKQSYFWTVPGEYAVMCSSGKLKPLKIQSW